MKHEGLNQLICAAVVNNGFRETLLQNPAKALATGYFGHNFSLTSEEWDLVVDIQAQRFEDFAAQVYHGISGNGNGNGYNGNGHRPNVRGSGEPFADVFRARVPVRA